MTTARRIVEELPPGMRHPPALDPRDRCRATIRLDGVTYRCGRAHVDGIHDAFAWHGDSGMVRW